MRQKSRAFFILFSILFYGWTALSFSQERFRKNAPDPDPLPTLNLPEIETASLSNGLTLSVIKRENLPLITVRLVIFAGELHSPEEFPGTAAFAANMVLRRSVKHDSEEIEEMVESIGGQFYASIFPDFVMFTFTFLEEFLDTGLEIISELILQPAFTSVEIASVKRLMFYDLLNKATDSEYIAKRQLDQILFINHPYSKSVYNEEVIKNLNERVLLPFFNTHYNPNHAWIFLTGNLSLGTASRKVSRYFQTWEKKNREIPALPSLIPNKKLKVCFVHKPEEKQATIFMGNILAPVSAVDIFPLLVINQVLGGTTTSRLFMNLRESKEYAYYAFSQLELFKACAVYLIRTRVRPEVTRAAVMETLGEMEKITKEKIPSFEIEQAKSYLIGNFPINIETHDTLSLKVAQIQAFQFGEALWDDYLENIMLIDSNRVFEAAQKYDFLSPVVVIVGDREILTEHLLEFEEVEVYDQKGVHLYTLTKETSDETR